jgi:hypothetical protein
MTNAGHSLPFPAAVSLEGGLARFKLRHLYTIKHKKKTANIHKCDLNPLYQQGTEDNMRLNRAAMGEC